MVHSPLLVGEMTSPAIPGCQANLCRRSPYWPCTTLTMTVCLLHAYWILLSWFLHLKYLWPLDLLSRNCISEDTSIENVPIQTSPCPIMMIKKKKRSHPIGQVPAGPLQTKPRWSVQLPGTTWVNMNNLLTKWTPGSHGKLGSLSLPISSNCSCVRLITVRSPMCPWFSLWHTKSQLASNDDPSLSGWMP
jgi:hypothetical protein